MLARSILIHLKSNMVSDYVRTVCSKETQLVIRCPYCASGSDFRELILQKEDGRFVCERCAHTVRPGEILYQCLCRGCLEMSHADAVLGEQQKKRIREKLVRQINSEGNVMSYSEARNHFEKGRNNTVDKGIIEMLDGLKHLSHALEEDLRTMEQGIRNVCDIQIKQTSTGPF